MLSALFDNPVVTKELRGRMRGSRTYWLLFGYVLLLSLILFFSYLGWWNQHSADMQTGGSSAGFTVGRTFFKILFYSQAVMMALITPALTAGAITVEREQRTFEMLRGTILRPGSIVWGKLASSVSFVVLLLTSSLPLLSLCFLLGGVSPGEVFFAYLLLIMDALLFGAIGICWSAYAGGTATATVLSYATLILFFVATIPFASPALSDGSMASFGLCALNPVGAVTGAVLPEHYYGWILPAWIPALLLNGTLTALLVLASINRLEDFPAHRAAALRGGTLLFAGLLIFFGNGIIFGGWTAIGIVWGVGFGSHVQLTAQLGLASALLLLLVPILVTGDLEGWAKKKAWSPRRILGEATLASGLPFALLLTAVVIGLTFAGTYFAAHIPNTQLFFTTQQLFRGRFGRPANLSLSPGQISLIIEQTCWMLLLVVAGIRGLGFLFSVLLNNRWTSLTLLYLTLLFAVALPYFSYATLVGEDAVAASHNFAVNALYLCPFVPIRELISPVDLQNSYGNASAITGMLGYGSLPLWVGTSLVYLAIGLVSFALAHIILRRQTLTKTA
ncbi:MAG: ABC transporter permease [Janthinobacterium lividum]